MDFPSDETQKLDELIARLEGERFKIDAFKRELPLCMHLLTNAMEASRQQLRSQRTKPVLEEFIPLTKRTSEPSENDESLSSDRSSWMTSLQLWSNHEADDEIKSSGASSRDRKTSPENEVSRATTQRRKARRCWSPDLHRKFINALHILGGPQVATPKQIRELMKVDGLTNDEVKSHLQKYRLHTRRPSPAPQAGAVAPPQVVVLGGIWVPPEYATAASFLVGSGRDFFDANSGGAQPLSTADLQYVRQGSSPEFECP